MALPQGLSLALLILIPCAPTLDTVSHTHKLSLDLSPQTLVSSCLVDIASPNISDLTSQPKLLSLSRAWPSLLFSSCHLFQGILPEIPTLSQILSPETAELAYYPVQLPLSCVRKMRPRELNTCSGTHGYVPLEITLQRSLLQTGVPSIALMARNH